MSADDIERQALEILKIIGEKLKYSTGRNNAISNFQSNIQNWFGCNTDDEYNTFISCISLLEGKGYIGVEWIPIRWGKYPSFVWLTVQGFDKLKSPGNNNATNSISLGGISNSNISGSTILVGQNNSSYINQGTIDFDKISSLSDEEKQKLSKLITEFENEKESKEGVWKKAKAILAFLLDKGVDVFIAVIPYVLNKVQNLF